jgi:hypothetical protein
MHKKYKSLHFYPEGNGIWVLKHDLEVNTGPFSSVKLEEGHRTNFASIPWPFTKLIDPDDDSIAIAAAIHDGLVGEFSPMVPITYRSQLPGGTYIEQLPNWAKAASILKKAMFGFRAAPWKRFCVYWAVRIYGIYKDFKHD